MALTKFEYVKSFELEDKLEPCQWIVLCLKLLDPKAFLRSNSVIASQDEKLRDLMLASSYHVVKEISNVSLSYGYSNVVNFVFKKHVTLYNRRASKLVSFTTSLFSSCFVAEWPTVIRESSIQNVPVFEGSVHLLPQDQCLRDFLQKEQKYCHEINLEETVVRKLIDVALMEPEEALKRARNSTASAKNELLFSRCNINYNNEPPQNKKGTILLRKATSHRKGDWESKFPDCGKNVQLRQLHLDFVSDEFWNCDFPLKETTKVNSTSSGHDSFQRKDQILPHCWLVVRIDGKGFHRFAEVHEFAKPNENRVLNLMSAAAKNVMAHFSIVFMAYGQSDEYSFVIRRYGHEVTEGYSLISRIVTVFTATFVQLWNEHYGDQELRLKPSFDARLVLYPTTSSLRDYLSWRQADCHINNMYNTCFWNLIRVKGLSPRDAQEYLKSTFSKDKLAILKNDLGIEYSEECPMYRKGTTIIRPQRYSPPGGQLLVLYEDLIGDQFWAQRPWLLGTEQKAQNETED